MQDKREKMPDERLGKFMAAVSIALTLLLLFLPHLDAGTTATCLAFGISGVIFGRGQIAAAKRWREKYGEPTSEELMAIKKNHSEKNHSVNIFRLLALIVIAVAGFILAFLGIVFLLHYLFHI